ncbi:PAS domain-containing sensor histidine kinase [Virgisporangium aliadipatigenens]|uniref:PAS domain-containing sensor histidine kinase n=1 Tax=Virgisporangium aliadipatigenens TaxID=741659 RepID=UPI001943366F|nr:ATP-binding protein [Virgisporangium aliadipatigenens]
MLRRPGRLAAVERARLLFTATGLPLERMARLTATAAGVPYAAISLLDADSERFLAVHGAEAPAEVPVDESMCQFVIAKDALVVVDAPQLSARARAAGLHAYAGYPIRLDGAAVGAFCVADVASREWSAEQLDVVRDAADLFTNLLANDQSASRSTLAAAQVDTVLAAMREAYVAVDHGGRILQWSGGAESMFGWEPAEAVGRPFDDLVAAEQSRAAARTARALAGHRTDQPARPLIWARHRDGHEFAVEMALSTTPGPDGPVVHAFLHDATERMDGQREAARHRAFLEALLESIDTAVAACDAQGRPVLLNHAMRRIFEVPEELGESWDGRYELREADGTPIPKERIPLLRALAGEEVRDLPYSVHLPGCSPRYFRANGHRMYGADGETLGAVLAVMETTDQVRTDRFKDCEVAVARILERNDDPAGIGEELLSAVTDALEWAGGALWLVDEEAGLLRLTATCDRDGAAHLAITPQSLARGEGFAGVAWERARTVWVRDFTTVDMISAETMARTGLRAGVALPIRSAEHTLGVLSFFSTHVEEPQRVLAALLAGVAAHVGQHLERRRAAGLAAELARSKDEYIGLVGHELRTPLTSISSYTDLVLDDPELTEEQRELLTVVARNAETLRGIIASLLDLAALDSGDATVRPQRADLASLLREALAEAEPEIAQRGHSTIVDVPPSLMAQADVPRIRQVIDTLLRNAARYTPRGGRITVRLADDGPEFVALTVSDTGMGIPEADRSKLFNRFFRGAGAKEAGIPGSGLGLAISRVVVERHGGSLSLGEHSGPGCTFVVRLPKA